jgi:hypothetical protein
MISFEDWLKDLISNYVWAEPAQMHYKPETFRATANKVYMQYVAAEVFPPIQEARRHVYNKLALIPGDKVKVDWVKEGLKKIESEKKQDWQPVSEEEREQWLKKWRESLNGLQTVSAVPRISYKEIAEQGGVLPPKDKPYPITTPEEAYVRDRRFEWIKNSFEPRTGQRLPESLDEQEFNMQYDLENYYLHVKKFKEWYDQHLNGKGK